MNFILNLPTCRYQYDQHASHVHLLVRKFGRRFVRRHLRSLCRPWRTCGELLGLGAMLGPPRAFWSILALIVRRSTLFARFGTTMTLSRTYKSEMEIALCFRTWESRGKLEDAIVIADAESNTETYTWWYFNECGQGGEDAPCEPPYLQSSPQSSPL